MFRLGHEGQFDLDAANQHFRIVVPTTTEMEQLKEAAPHANSHDFARLALSLLGRRVTDSVVEDQPLPAADVQTISDAELEEFARGFIVANGWKIQGIVVDLGQGDEKRRDVALFTADESEIPQNDGESATDYLLRLFKERQKQQEERFRKLMAPLQRDFLGRSLLSEQTERLIRDQLNLATSLADHPELPDLEPPDTSFLENLGPSPLLQVPEILQRVEHSIGDLHRVATRSANVAGGLHEIVVGLAGAFNRANKAATRLSLGMLLIAVLTLIASTFGTCRAAREQRESADQLQQLITVLQLRTASPQEPAPTPVPPTPSPTPPQPTPQAKPTGTPPAAP